MIDGLFINSSILTQKIIWATKSRLTKKLEFEAAI